MQSHLHSCTVEAEQIDRYRTGGYHPVHLGDRFKNDRYKVIHKLGYGAYSTVWLARDQFSHQYVALKIIVAESSARDRELRTLQSLRDLPDSTGLQHIERLLDNFQHSGPNGIHNCLVLELLGPNIPTIIERRFSDGRLPASIAKRVAKQIVLALKALHESGFAHGDLHTGNVVLEMPSLDSLTEGDLLGSTGKPQTGLVNRSDGEDLEAGMPKYLVWPAVLPAEAPLILENFKLIDFGESFRSEDRSQTLHTPLAVRAPEVIFGDEFDYRVDLWGLGCLIFELVTGQPPFDSVMTNKSILISQMIGSIGGLLPRWQRKWSSMRSEVDEDEEKMTLQAWLEEIYFDASKTAEMSHEEIADVGVVIHKLLRFDPQSRVGTKDILNHAWFLEQ